MLRTAALLFCLLTSTTFAADWPHVRGSGYDGHSSEKGLVDHWPKSGPPVLWTRELGAGYSAFVVAEGRAFTLFQTSGGMFLRALDVDTGADLWKERIDEPWQHRGMYPGPYASPTWNDGKVFYATPSGVVGCVQAADGRAIWKVNVREKFGTRGTDFGYASTPTVEQGRVYFPVGGLNAAMVAIRTEDGTTLWANGDEPASYCPAYPITLDGQRLIVGFFQNCLMFFDAKTGQQIGREKLSSSYDEHAAWPLFDGRQLLIASPFRVGSQLFHLNNRDQKFTIRIGWNNRQFSNDVSSSLLFQGAVYGFDIQQLQSSVHRASRGAFKCLDFATGKQNWESQEVGQASVMQADGKLILWAETGKLILAKATSEQYEELARTNVLEGGGMCWASPALSDKRLIVRDHKRAVCLWLGSPAELDPIRRTSTLTVSNRSFDWTRLLPREPEYPNDAPQLGEIALWFAANVGVFVISAVLACLWRKGTGRGKVQVIALAIAFGLGITGTTVIGLLFDRFILTWPLSLYVAFRSVLSLGLRHDISGWRHQIFTRLMLFLFVGVCYGYYCLCMVAGYAMGWGFLGGFVVAWPFVWYAERTSTSYRNWVAEGVGFAVYFWVSGLIPAWKAAYLAAVGA